MMAAMVSVLWAYDGWTNVTPLAEEIRDPGRNIPRALIWGMAVLIAVYLSMTLAYHYVLPMSEIASASSRAGHCRERRRRRLLRAPPGAAGRRRHLDPRHVLDVHLAQRQRPDRPAGLLRDGARRAFPERALPRPPDVSDSGQCRSSRRGSGPSS